MDEPRTHYQISFTSRQALLLFVGLLIALGAAYTFGVLTGLAGRDKEPNSSGAVASTTNTAPAASAPAPEPTASASAGNGAAAATSATAELEVPKPVRGVSSQPSFGGGSASGRSRGSVTRLAEPAAGPAPTAAASAPAPTPSPGLQLFEDEGGPVPTRPARPASPSGPSPARRPTPRPASPSAASASFWVQALSATSEKEAKSLRDRLAAHGFSAVVLPGPGAHGAGRVYRVRVGPFSTRDEAEKASSKLKTREKLRPWVVPPGK